MDCAEEPSTPKPHTQTARQFATRPDTGWGTARLCLLTSKASLGKVKGTQCMQHGLTEEPSTPKPRTQPAPVRHTTDTFGAQPNFDADKQGIMGRVKGICNMN